VIPSRRPWLLFGPAALAAGAVGVILTLASDHEEHPGYTISLALFVSLSFVVAGLIGWTRRPENRIGMLMVAVGFGVLATSLYEANHPIPYTLGSLFGTLFIAVFLHLLLAYPNGRLLSRRARAIVVGAYITAFLGPLLDSMFPERHTCKPHACPDNLVFVSHDHAAHVAETALWTTVAVALFASAFALLIGRWRRATPAMRRQLRPVYLAGGLSVLLLAIGFVVTPFTGVGNTIVGIALIVTFTAVPFLFLAGLLGTTLARSAGVGAIFSSVPERASPGEVQEGLRVALRDPTADIAYWYEEGGHYVDVDGNHFELPNDANRARAGQAARRGEGARRALPRRAAGDARPDVPDRSRRHLPRLQRSEHPRSPHGRGRRTHGAGAPAAGARRPGAGRGPGRRRPRHSPDDRVRAGVPRRDPQLRGSLRGERRGRIPDDRA
jgi:hypothetical protein